MNPIIFSASDKSYYYPYDPNPVYENPPNYTNGLGRLSDAITCSVHEERNGSFELTMKYPINGRHAEHLIVGNVIVATHDHSHDLQPFRIYQRDDSLEGTLSINARHIANDLAKYPIKPFSASSVSDAIAKLRNSLISVINPVPFIFQTDISNPVSDPQIQNYGFLNTGSDITPIGASLSITKPSSIHNVIGDSENSILRSFEAEIKYDRNKIEFLSSRGEDRHVSIRYGKNITSLGITSTSEEVYRAVYPFYCNSDSLVEGSIQYVNPPGYENYDPNTEGAYLLDLSDSFSEVPAVSELELAAITWLNNNKPWLKAVSGINVSFVDLAKTKEYEQLEPLQTVLLCDTVSVYYPEINFYDALKVMSVTYDVLAEEYTEMEIGRPEETVADIIQNRDQELSDGIDGAKDLTSMVANGSYPNGTFIDNNYIYSPNIYGKSEIHSGMVNEESEEEITDKKYNFNVYQDGSMKVGYIPPSSPESSSSTPGENTASSEANSSTPGENIASQTDIYKLEYDSTSNELSLYGNYAVHKDDGTPIGYMGRISGSAGEGSATEGVAFSVGNSPDQVSDNDDSFFLCTKGDTDAHGNVTGGARLNFMGNKVYASANHVTMQHKDGPKIDISTDNGIDILTGKGITISSTSSQNGISIRCPGGIFLSDGIATISIVGGLAYYGTDEIETK